MKHAGPGALDRLEPVLRMIRSRTALVERSRGVFYRGRDPFLHFHEDPAGFFCDIKIDGRFRRHPATTKAQQRTLVARVIRLARISPARIPLPQWGEGRVRGPASAMPNVLVTMPFNESQLGRLRAVSSDLRVTCEDAEKADYSATDILYAGMPPRDLARAPRLKWVQLHMAGVNALYDHPLYTDSANILTTTSGVHGPTIAEYAITVLLALAHRVPRMVEWKTRGAWPPDERRWPLFVPTEVRGAVLGIIGYGSIGRELARIAKSAFRMTVIACKRDPSVRADPGYQLPGTGDPEGALPDEWLAPEKLTTLLSKSDVVVMCAPLTRETQAMIGARELEAMKPSAYFINVGRGATVDETALAKALRDRRIAGAAIDVFAQEPPPAGHPLYALDNVIVSPHVSGFLPNYDDKCAELFAENLRRFLAGEPLLNLVDRAKGY